MSEPDNDIYLHMFVCM